MLKSEGERIAPRGTPLIIGAISEVDNGVYSIIQYT